MSLNIGRKGWVGVALEATAGVPVTPTDYAPFVNNTFIAKQDSIEIESANSIREKTYGAVPGKRWSEGDVEINLDSKIAGYFMVGAMGTVSVASQGGGVYLHTMTRNNSNTPQTLTVVSNRAGVDSQQFANVAVDTLSMTVKDGLATAKATLKGGFPNDTTSGTGTTASGNLFTFKNAALGFGSSVAAAQSAANLKPHEATVTIKNNVETVFRHGNNAPDTVNVHEFEAELDFMLYFESTTDRNSYYNVSKQCASLTFTGAGLGGGNSELLRTNFYQIHFDSMDFETGLSNFFAEKGKAKAEYDAVNAKSVDMNLQNTKSLYI
jgi:hypothetical protein